MKLLMVFLLAAESLVCSSQKTSDSLILTEFKNYTIKLPDVQPGSLGILPFHTIRVWDARPDTSSISFYFPENSHPGKLNFKDGLADAFQKFALTGYYFGGDTLNDLLIIIKVFRVSDFANVKVSNNIVSNWFAGAVVSAELFLQHQNSFHALYKVDSIVLATRISESAKYRY